MTAETGTDPGVPEADAPSSGSRALERLSRLAAYYELTKPGIAGFVLVTAGVSYWVGTGGTAALLPLLHVLAGTLLATAGSLALNQYMEREVDAVMHRTRSRPIPSGRLLPREAFVFGLVLVLGGVAWLALTLGWLPAAITAASAAAYNLIYTPLKKRSYVATLVGAIPGALPALIGWSAATGSVSLGGLVLFAIAFLWQLPHVLALGWMLKEDYARAGFLMVPPDSDGSVIARQMILYSVTLLPVSLFPYFLQLTGPVYFFGALALGLFLLGMSGWAARRLTRDAARKVFLATLLYHPVVLGLMVVDTLPGGMA